MTGIICFLLLLLTAVSCSHEKALRNILEEADSLSECYPDSARRLLREVDGASVATDRSSQALFSLLMAQTGYVLYDSVPSDSVISSAVSYYETCGNKELCCRAVYYRAMNLYVDGKHETALELLKRGEQMAVETGNNLYCAKYHESLCMVNDRAQFKEQMLKYARLFLDDALALGDTAFIARGYSHVATAYFSLNQVDEAEKFIVQTLPLLDGLKQTSKAYILTNIACVYHRQGRLTASRQLLEQSLKAHPMENTYAELGDIYAEEGRWADAERSWQNALKAKDPLIVKNTLSSIVNHYKTLDDKSKALSALEELFAFSDSVARHSEKVKLAEIQHRFDQQVTENRMQKTVNRLLSLTIVSIVIIFAGIYIHRKAVRRYTSKLDKSLKALKDTQVRLSLVERERQQQIKQKGEADEEHSRKIKTLERELDDIRREVYERVGAGKRIYDAIQENQPLMYRNDESSLVDYYSVFHFNAYSQWKSEYGDLSLRLLTFLILQDLGKSDEEICLILNIERVSLRSIKSRLRKMKRS